MTGKIPQAFIDELLNRTDLVTLIDAYVPLRKKGVNYSACCPFHQEKTPSFSVSPQKQIYHCFGCGAGGNALRFLMEYERLNFIEAVSLLAKQAGLTLPQENKSYESASPLYDIMLQIANYYHQQLKNSSDAIDYLKSRGITGVMAKDYQLGFAPSGWNNLLELLGRQTQTQHALLQTGMLIKKDSGNVYDRFRGRIMFPIRDTKGRVIAFGGRVFSKDEEPKYLNSPETPLFHKGRELYGLYEARRALREIDYFIVVEGYMDVLALVQYGIHHVVGTLGTATTAEHLTKLLRYSKKIVFCFDGDRAGREAAWRALQVALPFLEDGVQLSFMFLPQEDDPDSFIRRSGKELFLAEVKKALPFSDFMFRHIAETIDLSTLDGKASFSHAVTPLINKIPEGALKQLIYEKLSHLISLNSTQVRALAKKNVPEIKQQIAKKKNPAYPKQALTPLRLSMMLLLQNPHLVNCIPPAMQITEWEQPESELLREIIAVLKKQPHLSSAQLLETWQEPTTYPLISALLMKEHLVSEEEIEKEFLQILLRLEQQYNENKIEKMLMKAKTQGLSSEERVLLQALIADVKS